MSFTAFQKECLDAHNAYRSQHGAPPLELSREICNYANEWAQHLASRNSLQHRNPNKYGENLYMCYGASASGKDGVKAWYDEIKQYNFSRQGFSSGTGHFTQVVWKGSRKLGVAKATVGSRTVIVANYYPPGNMMNNFAANVSPRVR